MPHSGQPLTYDNFVPEVRFFLRDFPELNRLISGEETGNRLINYCVHLAIDEFNTTPPLTTSDIGNFPSRTILLYLTVIHVLTSAALLHARNRFSYNDGGYSVETEQQEALYQRWIQLFRSQISGHIQNLKIAQNIERGWGGGVGSEYGWIHGWYGLS
jgi:hypothetical protein